LLSAGMRVGPYEVLAPLGAGGMGEVYRARDARLGRDVALKVLPPDSSVDPERLRRFQREARAVAALNHPHIIAVYDVGSDNGVDYVVFELLEGQTLRRRLESGRLPPRKVVEYGVQLCRGLAAAHGRGVVHRDLKPENLFLTAGGQVKILDFGLARQTGPGGDEDEVSRAETRSAVMGTAGYMSPEQAQGQRADARSDLFALGAILYEMLSGRRAFWRSTRDETLAAVLRSDPPEIEAGEVPPGLDRVVRRCLEKDPGERFQSAHDLGLALETLSGPGLPIPGSKRQRRILRSIVAGLAALGAIVIGLVMWRLWARGLQRQPTDPVRIVPFTADGGLKFAPRLSPDRERVAYSWTGPGNDNWDVYVKAIGHGTRPLRLTEHKASDLGPVWSPDGRQIAFVRELGTEAAIYTVPSHGGQERRLIEVAGSVRSQVDGSLIPFLSWSADEEWLAYSEKLRDDEPARIVRLSLATLQKEPLTSPPEDSLGDLYPELSPDGRRLAFVRAASRVWGFHDVWVQPVEEQRARRLTFAKYTYCGGLAWTADGADLVYAIETNGSVAGGQIVRVPVAGGDPRPLAGVGSDVAWPSIRADRMVHAQLVPSPGGIWRMRGRRSSPADRVPQRLIASQWNDLGAAYSPDGRRIAFASDRSGTQGVWVSDEHGANPVPLTASFSSLGGGGSPWSPDGRRIVFFSKESGSWDLYLVDSKGGRPRRLTHERSAEGAGSFSRDGRFVYFFSDRSGQLRIWKMPVDGGPARQVSQRAGYYAQESWDGRSVYFSDPHEHGIWKVPVEGGEETLVVRGLGVLTGWDISPAGIYYAMTRPHDVAGGEYTVRFLDFESGRTETLLRKEGHFWHDALRVSPDEKWILYDEEPVPQSEIMLTENFR
jgi:eukaryotic-like serine/threonine-protein kinase